MTRNRIFDSLLKGKSIEAKTKFEVDCVKQFTRYILYKEFGRRPIDIASMPVNEYDDIVLLISKRNAIQKIENEKAARTRKK